MTNLEQEKELTRFHEDQKAKKIAYCRSIGLNCKDNCPQDKAGCLFHPDHEKAIKEELPTYEG